jgi:hypothetical protein
VSHETLTAETLTAEERDSLECSPYGETTKLLRLYDAALARAEAADDHAFASSCARDSAESRLAEATALLEHVEQVLLQAVRPQTAAMVRDFLSGSTPAPAASLLHQAYTGSPEQERLLAAMGTPAHAADSECHPAYCEHLKTAPAAESEPTLADLERIPVGALVLSAGVEHPKVRALESRIAKLEAENTRAAKAVLKAHGITNAHKTRIAKAVAVLEAGQTMLPRHRLDEHVTRTLELLRGNRT